MLLDTQSMFADAQAVTATAVSENVIDFGLPGTPKHAAAPITQDIGRGRHIPILIQVVETFATLTNLSVVFQTDDDEAFGSFSVVAETPSIPAANLVAGYRFPIQYIPKGLIGRYGRLNFFVGGSNATAGRITAGLVFGDGDWSA